MGRLTNACSPFVGPVAEMKRATENIWDGKLYAKCERTSPGRRAVSTSELKQWEPCQDDGGTEKERKVPGRETTQILRQEQAQPAQGTARRGQDGVRGTAGSTSPTEAKLEEITGLTETYQNILPEEPLSSSVKGLCS